jgi:site-specific recombinase XerD
MLRERKMEFEAKIYHLQSGGYQVAYRHPVTRRRHRITFAKLRDASTARQELEMQFYRGNKAHFVESTVGALVDMHLKDCPHTRFNELKRPYNDFMAYFKDTKLKSLDRHVMAKWLEELRAKYSYSDRTMNKIKSCLNSFFKYLIQKEILRDSPLQGISFKRTSLTRPRVILSEEELGHYLRQAKEFSPGVFYPFLYTLAHTGARMGEIVKLTWGDVDLETRFLHLHKTKNGENRSLKMADMLHAMLLEMKGQASPAPESSIFRNRGGEPITKAVMKHYLKQFKLKYRHEKNWTFHSLRHSFAYNFLKKGGQMYSLQAVLGHKSIQMTVDLYGNLKAVDVENPSPYGF